MPAIFRLSSLLSEPPPIVAGIRAAGRSAALSGLKLREIVAPAVYGRDHETLLALAFAFLMVASYPATPAAAQSATGGSAHPRDQRFPRLPSRVIAAESGSPIPTDKTKKITVPAGGAEHMATLVKQLSEGHKNTIFVAAGDLIGASPLLSAMFHDEPTIELLSMMGLAIASVGNHEFDEGKDELQADAEWRLPSGRSNAAGRIRFHRREISLSRRLHDRDRDRQDGFSALRNQGVRRHSRRLHRPDLERHRRHHLAGERSRPRIPRRGRDRECAGAGIESTRRRSDRRPDSRRRLSDRRL